MMARRITTATNISLMTLEFGRLGSIARVNLQGKRASQNIKNITGLLVEHTILILKNLFGLVYFRAL